MKKIPTLFVRDFSGDPKHVTREVNPECAWVLAGEGKATRKYDGTCVMFDGERWWARREIKPGKPVPDGFVEVATDDETGTTVGWESAEFSGFRKYLAEAIGQAPAWQRGTYELCGPKINGNPEKLGSHFLISHAAAAVIEDEMATYDQVRTAVLGYHQVFHAEGIVWHHPDGHMAKIKARDFPQVAR